MSDHIQFYAKFGANPYDGFPGNELDIQTDVRLRQDNSSAVQRPEALKRENLCNS